MTKSTTIAAKICTAFTLVFLLGVSASQASLMLRVTDTPLIGAPTTVTASDQNAPAGTTPDNSAILGFLSTSFSTPNFSVVSSSGASKPLAPNSNVRANLDLLQLAVSSQNGGWLTIELSDNNYTLGGLTLGDGFFGASIGGTLGSNALNTVQVDYYYNTSNVLFDTVGASSINSSLFSGGGSFSENIDKLAVNGVNKPFSLTQVVRVHMEANQIISFDSDSHVVPEPGMLLLMGLGLIGLTFARRHNR